MTASARPVPAVRAAFTALVDYAGIFPPAQLPLDEAVAEYVKARSGPYAWMLGRFIVRSSQFGELVRAVPAGERFTVSVVLDGGIESLGALAQACARAPALALETLEIALPPDRIEEFAAARRALSAAACFVETSGAAMPALARLGLGAKIRCGGADAQAFPAPEAVAEFIAAACAHRVPFKATAGLHHPVRHFHLQSGVTMHGFLNILAATALAREGAAVRDIAMVIGCQDEAAFSFDGEGLCVAERRIGSAQLQSMREQSFIAYGSCSFSEPVEDLRAMHVLE